MPLSLLLQSLETIVSVVISFSQLPPPSTFSLFHVGFIFTPLLSVTLRPTHHTVYDLLLVSAMAGLGRGLQKQEDLSLDLQDPCKAGHDHL